MAAVVAGGLAWSRSRVAEDRRVWDEAGIVGAETGHFENYLLNIHAESGVDIRVVLLRRLGDEPIENAAIRWMGRLGIGARDRRARGALLLFDMAGGRFRMEVGYGLEEYFPDAFVAYLVSEHAPSFFKAGQPTLGLHLMVRILHYRIRSAVFGKTFDPGIVAAARKVRARALSGGAGASGALAVGRDASGFIEPLDPEVKARLVAGRTPDETQARHLEWLAIGRNDPDVGLFTAESRAFLHRPTSPGYLAYMFLMEYGKTYRTYERRPLALAYCVDDPMNDPHLYRLRDGRWEMDIVAEVRNTQNLVNLLYTWHWRGSNDDFSRAFADKLLPMADGFVRVVGGDNRLLPRAPAHR